MRKILIASLVLIPVLSIAANTVPTVRTGDNFVSIGAAFKKNEGGVASSFSFGRYISKNISVSVSAGYYKYTEDGSSSKDDKNDFLLELNHDFSLSPRVEITPSVYIGRSETNSGETGKKSSSIDTGLTLSCSYSLSNHFSVFGAADLVNYAKGNNHPGNDSTLSLMQGVTFGIETYF